MEILVLLLGILYGLIIGIIPAAGATTGLVTVFAFLHLFPDPYLAVIFCMAVVAASTTGDSFAGVLLGIPGANSAATTMIDGHPLALQGKATYALTAAIVSSTLNGILWGSLVFFFLPYYGKIIYIFGIPELWIFTVLAFVCVTFISSKLWFRSLVALSIGIFLGAVGTHPETASARFTGGWFYLEDGVQLMALVAGLFAFPELIAGLRRGGTIAPLTGGKEQRSEGIKAVWDNRWLSLRGGAIGAFIGMLPALGGAIGDWIAYGQTVATNPKEEFGKGNIKGVIGPEGVNNAQKATSMLPTVLFGIPGAKYAAVLLSLFSYLNFEMGSFDLLQDTKFFESLTFGFMYGSIIVGIICMLCMPMLASFTQIEFKYYAPLVFAFVTWAAVQYTGGWEDYFVLVISTLMGLLLRKYKFSRPALLLGFMLSGRIENLTHQMTGLYTIESVMDRPLFIALTILTLGVLTWGLTKRSQLDFA
jgi:putative tricarboxylic transport membrane protein